MMLGLTRDQPADPVEYMRKHLDGVGGAAGKTPRDGATDGAPLVVQYHAKENGLGRGEWVRLILEQAGAKYSDGEECLGLSFAFKGVFPGGGATADDVAFPAFAPPMLQQGGFTLAQTPAICQFIGRKYGLAPADPQEDALALQLTLTVNDMMTEGRNAYHAKEYMASYKGQEEFTQPYVDKFVASRVPKLLAYFDAALGVNPSSPTVFGALCYADLALFHALQATEASFPATWKEIAGRHPRLATFKDYIGALPRVRAYLQSDRRGNWAGDSMT